MSCLENSNKYFPQFFSVLGGFIASMYLTILNIHNRGVLVDGMMILWIYMRLLDAKNKRYPWSETELRFGFVTAFILISHLETGI